MQITVEGTIAPWIWTGSQYVLRPLIDPGIFAPAGTSLTGDAIQITWNDDPVTAVITINGVTACLGHVPEHHSCDVQPVQRFGGKHRRQQLRSCICRRGQSPRHRRLA
jgi:hypothetical protein